MGAALTPALTPASGAALRRFVVLGDVATDVVAHVRRAVEPGTDTPARVRLSGGGAGANVAAWLTQACPPGVAVHLVGRIGDDPAGRARAAELQAAGVRTSLAVDAELPTGTIVVLVHRGPGGEAERTMLPDRGANLAFAREDVPTELLTAGAHLHVSGYALLEPGPRPAALHALTLARAAGCTTSVDPASAAPLRAVGAGRFLEWVAGVDLLLPNLDEARVLTGAEDAREAASALAQVAGEAVVTCAAQGAVWSDGTRTVAVPAAGVAQTALVDATGAGDAFAAGYLVARFAGAPPAGRPAAGAVETRLSAAAALAARAVAGVGARPS